MKPIVRMLPSELRSVEDSEKGIIWWSLVCQIKDNSHPRFPHGAVVRTSQVLRAEFEDLTARIMEVETVNTIYKRVED